jgi:hypothetical protein
MVKTIELTQGKVAIVDDEDYDELNKYKWYAHKDHQWERWYASRMSNRINGKRKLIMMHRKIMKDSSGKIIDHKNHDGLDNRKCNLRICNCSQNTKNSKIYKTNTSGFNGVIWNKERKKWRAQIYKDYQTIFIGYFKDKEVAARAVDEKAIELFGEFAILNFCRPTQGGDRAELLSSAPTTIKEEK